jgi:hypothetical protein
VVELASSAGPNPNRVAAGRLNRKKRGPLTPRGRQALREAAVRNQPWIYSTGPRTPAGKAQAARNGKSRQLNSCSIREIRARVADARALISQSRHEREVIERTPNAPRGSGSAADPS